MGLNPLPFSRGVYGSMSASGPKSCAVAASVCEDTKAARKKAHSTFIRMATRMPDLLVPYLELIVNQTTQLMRSGMPHLRWQTGDRGTVKGLVHGAQRHAVSALASDRMTWQCSAPFRVDSW